MTIDWNAKLEVFNRDDGAVHSLDPIRPNPDDNRFWPFLAYAPARGCDFYINKNNCSVNSGMSTGDWIIRNAQLTTDELTELREFKRKALERYPELEPKPETDEEYLDRNVSHWAPDFVTPLPSAREVSLRAALGNAIQWARDNPRA